MSNAALIALTAPIWLGEAPEAIPLPPQPPQAAIEAPFDPAPLTALPAAPQIASQNALASSERTALISLQWSLAAQAVEGPPEPREDTDETGTPEDSEEGAQTEGETGEEGGDVIIVQGTYGPQEGDPMAEVNETSYRLTQQIDDAFVEPVAYAYRDGLPDPLRDGLGNVVRNLREPNNALNFLLQGKVGKTFETLGRLLINSTLGIGGLIDVAGKPGIGLPYRRNGWGNTLGYYGVGTGPYLYLPITGPSNARDLVGSGLDQLLLPLAVGKPFNQPEYTIPFFVVDNLDSRLEFDEEFQRIEDTVDPYTARRDTYLYRRERDIALLKGEEPPPPPAILEEVEGTGEFADPPQEAEPADAPSASETGAEDGAAAFPEGERPVLAITRRREGR